MFGGDQLQFAQPKSAAADLDYTVDWTAWLAPGNDTIASATFAIAPVFAPGSTQTAMSGDCVVANAYPPITLGQVSCWISAGIPGRLYALTVTITTVVAPGGHARTDARRVLLRVVA
jgi:hypothetical protein